MLRKHGIVMVFALKRIARKMIQGVGKTYPRNILKNVKMLLAISIKLECGFTCQRM